MRIAFTGSHGCGKTTLANNFPNRIDEIARTVIKKVGSPKDMEQEQGDEFQQEIMDKQIQAELNMVKYAGWFVSDRSVIDVLAYATRFCSHKKLRELKDQAEKHIKEYPYDIIFYVPIEFPLEKDWLRFEDEHYQEIIDLQILKLLKRYKIKYVLVSGTVEQRLQIVNEAINSITK